MRDAYRRRPNDFHRRIIQTNIPKNVLLNKEHEWLQLIKEEELGSKYYNLRKHKWGHWTDKQDTRTIRQKIGDAHRGKSISSEHKKSLQDAAKKSNIQRLENGTHNFLNKDPKTEQKRIEASIKAHKGIPRTEDTKRKLRQANLGKKLSMETRKKISESKMGNIPWNKGNINTKMRGTKFYNNGEKQGMFIPGQEPGGWTKGRITNA
jgi:hypothetical protein